MINIGNSNVTNIYIGNQTVSKVYLGSTEVWSASSGTPIDYSTQYFTIEMLSGGTITWDRTNVQYSLNDGAWTAWDNTNGIALSTGDKLRMKRTISGFSTTPIGSTGYFKVYGNALSLLYNDNFSGQTSLTGNQPFAGMFQGNTYLIDAENLVIPITGVTGLNWSFNGMFNGCSNLEKAPVLEAKVFTKEKTYNEMFKGCSKLNYIKCLLETTDYPDNFSDWVREVASTGTFVKSANATFWTTGNSGIPSGWNIISI